VFAVAVSLVTPASVRGPTPQAKADPALVRMAAEQPNVVLPLIVREVRPGSNEAERVVRSLGGTVNYELPIIGSFSARVPAGSLPGVMNSPAVWSVWADGRIQASSTNLSQYDTASPDTSWQSTISPSGSGSTGAETTVALIDTGITPSADLGNRVLAMVDFTADHDGIDRYGHGTHMAGIIAGDGTLSNGAWAGVAPRANLVSVKVAGADGSTDVSVVIAAMQWVVSHKANYNIRVLNLSFGTDSTQSYLVDPLDYAVEQVWSSGIFIAAAAGNRGPSSGTINKPADDVLVVTVGAADTQGTPRRNDDVVAPFSSRGPTQDGLRGVDLVAPAISIVSIRAAGSTIDQLHPAARVGVSYFKGTGTSQAAAMVSGAAANMISANPALTPDVVKAILLRTADPKILYNPGGWAAGAGMLDASAAVWQASRNSSWIPPANQGVLLSAGLGSLELSRGSYHVYADINGDGIPDLVTGEIDVLGNSWSGNSWSGNSWAGNSWSGALWAGNSWSGNSWSGDSWS
jgi:serine protease AprX